jgi:predicted metalloprotease with PDZ domain
VISQFFGPSDSCAGTSSVICSRWNGRPEVANISTKLFVLLIMNKPRFFVYARRSKDFRTAGTVFVLLALCAFPAWGQSASYKVHLNFDRPLRATVEAQLEAPDGAIFTARHSGGYAWWDFIKNLHEVRDDGVSIPLQPVGDGHWTLPAGGAGFVRLKYDVDLSFTENIRVGDLRGGLFFGDSLYVVNRALFLMSNSDGPKDIEFDTPAAFAIATPWQKIGDHHFRASNNQELTANWTILGRFPAVEFEEGQFQVTFAFPGVSAAEQSLLQPLFKPVLHEYLRIFPQTPPTHLFFAFFHGEEETGEGYSNSTTLTMVDPITPVDRILWTNLLAHEIFHHWNGTLLSPRDDDKSAWFYEGATEYMANRTIIRTGLISQELFLKKLEIHVGMYDYWIWAPPFQKSTLESAVRDGGGDKDVNRPAIYNGGVVASFCLDTIIQKQTSRRKNLEDLLRLMMTRYGLTGKQYSPDDLIRDASEVAGTDLSSFFLRYIASRERLPVKQCLADAGFDAALTDYGGEAFIFPQTNPPAPARAIREQLTAQH